MRQDPYKKRLFRNWLIPKVVGAGLILIIIVIVVIVTSLNESSEIYNEGAAKAIPLLSDEKINMLGNLYVNLNNEFEQDIKNMELNYANRTNKRGDKIHYGVNGKENVDEMVNDDYVNGIATISYVKGTANTRKDGESNFTDMLAFLSVAMGSDVDRYSEEELKGIFTELFHLTHTFSGTTTELYPCEHGCAWCKYYCGDSRCQGEVGGNTVGFYKSDLYMGIEGEYGLMYDPFLISKRSNYNELVDMAGDEHENRTTYQYKVIEGKVVGSGDNVRYVREIKNKGDTVVAEEDEIYEMYEPEGYCPVCSGGRQTFTSTTRKFGGCITQVECHHGDILYIPGEEGSEGTYIDWYMDRDKGNCDNVEAVHACTHICGESCEGENGCVHEGRCLPEDIGCAGYYVCDEGHDHYACPGHIIVCCFGHTNLNLEMKIMYYEEMIDTLK